MQQAADKRAILVLLFGASMIGFGPVLVRLSHEANVGMAAAAFWRVTLALPILTAMILRPAARAGASLRPTRIAVFAGFLFAGDLVCWHYGIRYAAIATATVLSNMTPILVTIAAWVMMRQAPRPVFVVGMTLAVAGSAVMALTKGGAGVNPPLGDALAAAAALWYAAYMLAVREARQSMGASALLFWSSLVGSPLLLICALSLGEPILPTTALGLFAICGLGAMHVAGQGAIAWALGRLPAPLAAVVVLIQPVVAGLAGWAAFHETITSTQALGGAIALAGVAIAQATGRGPAPAPAAAPETA
jgi:drug/metabolite transporter (DMT)-like permease